jgi:hypothetical protein
MPRLWNPSDGLRRFEVRTADPVAAPRPRPLRAYSRPHGNGHGKNPDLLRRRQPVCRGGASSELRPRQLPTKYEVQSAKTFWSLWPGKRRGAASHGGEANRPITNQGKANGAGMQEKNHPALTTTVQVVPADKTTPSGT